MMIHSMYRDYQANFDSSEGFIDALAQVPHHYVVIDENVLNLYGKLLAPLLEERRFFVLKAIEENKTVAKALEIVDQLVQLETKKNTVLIAIGGGITQDVSCFVASVLYRGIDWFFVPTTLLAQTDSCIGSKSSINYGEFKNLIGTFYPPTSITIHPSFVRTLSHRDYLSGLGEIFKVAIMRGKTDFYAIRAVLPKLLQRDEAVLQAEVEKTLAFKKAVIEIDEFDKDYRNIMNYGHTFGHALEAESAFRIPHGQGVTAGLMIANEVSLSRGLISRAYRDDMCDTLTQILETSLLDGHLLSSDVLIPAMRKDKKFLGHTHTCILVDETCARKYTDIHDEEIAQALNTMKTYWRIGEDNQ